MRNSSRAVGTKSTFHPLARIVMIMSRYSSVKEARGSMTVLAPCAEMPPSKYMLLGTLKWME